ncbi:hypothetical protein TNCV_513211 [Trichonephila clavipes]|nr:hypothetical protein TNCV_513211 [Trichonephila clavipes]
MMVSHTAIEKSSGTSSCMNHMLWCTMAGTTRSNTGRSKEFEYVPVSSTLPQCFKPPDSLGHPLVLPTATIIAISIDSTWFATPCSMICHPRNVCYRPSESVEFSSTLRIDLKVSAARMQRSNVPSLQRIFPILTNT